jgi:4a-hydroxytetrahydrobiopterin dehydratase
MTPPIITKETETRPRLALNATAVVANLAKLEGWTLNGDGPEVVIEKTYSFDNYYQTMAFVNAVAFIAHTQNHHPHLSVEFKRCVVRFNTHDVAGLTLRDFDCAARVDALTA